MGNELSVRVGDARRVSDAVAKVCPRPINVHRVGAGKQRAHLEELIRWKVGLINVAAGNSPIAVSGDAVSGRNEVVFFSYPSAVRGGGRSFENLKSFIRVALTGVNVNRQLRLRFRGEQGKNRGNPNCEILSH